MVGSVKVTAITLSTRQAAEVLRLSPDTVRVLADSGALSSVLLPSGQRRYLPAAIWGFRRQWGLDAAQPAGASSG